MKLAAILFIVAIAILFVWSMCDASASADRRMEDFAKRQEGGPS